VWQSFLNSLQSLPPFPLWVELLKILVPVSAAVWVALRQLRISKGQLELIKAQAEIAQAKLKLDLFDKRYRVYRRTIKAFKLAIRGDVLKYGNEIGNPFNEFAADVLFLFGEDIQQYLMEAHRNWDHLWGVLVIAEKNYDGVIKRDDIPEWGRIKSWYMDQMALARGKFGKYMGFDRWH
jgi:hypothetical protein